MMTTPPFNPDEPPPRFLPPWRLAEFANTNPVPQRYCTARIHTPRHAEHSEKPQIG